MSSKSNYLEDAILNHVLRNTALTSPSTVYVGLFTVAAGEGGGQTEVSGNNYSRKAITFAAPSGGTCTQSGDVLFDVASGNWGTIVGYGIFDASTAGNLLYYSTVTPNKAINTNDQAKIASGTVVVSES
jgi:hypothetical protein